MILVLTHSKDPSKPDCFPVCRISEVEMNFFNITQGSLRDRKIRDDILKLLRKQSLLEFWQLLLDQYYFDDHDNAVLEVRGR